MFKRIGILLVLPMFSVSANTGSPEVSPGLYRITGGISGQDVPAGMVEESVEQCVTKEDLEADPASVLGDSDSMAGCTISDYNWSNGKISMTMKCSIEGYDATSVSHGTYDANGYEMVTVMKVEIEGETLRVESFVRGERIGDCE